MKNKFPKGWRKVTLNDVATWGSGGTPKSTENKYYKGEIPWLIIADLNNGIIKHSEKKITKLGMENSSAKWVEIGSVLIALYGSIGKLGIAGIRCTTNQAIAFTKKIRNGISNYYLFYYLMSQQSELLIIGHGGTQKNISQTILKSYPIPIPPFNEQKRIVSKLDKILPTIENINERIENIPKILKKFRQSVLHQAVTGKLTEDWRKDNITLINIEEYIKKLFEFRISKLEKTKEKIKIEKIFNLTDNEYFDLPEEWRFMKLKKLCYSFDYGSSKKSLQSGKVPVLRMGNIQNGEIDWQNLKYSNTDSEISKYLLKKNTVLFNRTNSPELVGKTAIYRGEHKAIFAGYLIRIKNTEFLDPEYLNYCLNSSYAKEYCMNIKSDGVSQSNINAQKLADFEIPFCSLLEQKEIVKRIEKLFLIADKIETKYKKAKSNIDKITQSVLAKAFRGELVPQDPNDEPAEELLKKLK